ncbi:hypothetical protein Syun_011582 [Stephania yunnanensis]|uniref:Uncharacterized protein n=1 Tax=Stephania yunnanensis TaxID=152371 RepID=A0AAP0JXS6_9MAGN
MNNARARTAMRAEARRQTMMASEATTTEGDGFGGSDGRRHDLRQTRRQLVATTEAPTSADDAAI